MGWTSAWLRRAWPGLAAALIVATTQAEERSNLYGDPFEPVTQAMAACPVPEGPLLTETEMRAENHWRAERGTSCYTSGRCRLPNAYLYDREIIPRVQRFLQRDGRFDDTSVWVLGQRRWVFLKGCVQSIEQAQALERAVRGIDDVEAVINELMVGTSGRPPYPVAVPVRP